MAQGSGGAWWTMCSSTPSAMAGTFSVRMADVHARWQEIVEGRYELDGLPAPTTVALKIVDMLGEEVLHVEGV